MHPVWYYLVSFLLSLGIVYATVPFIRKFAVHLGFVDQPNGRKIHKEPIPLLGGLSIYCGFLVTAAWMGKAGSTFWGIAIGGFLIFSIGVLDDFYKTRGKDFKALPKFLMQIAAAVVLVLYQIRITGISLPFQHRYDTFPLWVSVLATVLWVVAITNMMNFLDGVDGLAAGIAAISAMTLFFVALLKGQPVMAVFSIALMGSAIGFLRHNFYPARIFMGDAGATFLGFVLAAIAVDGAFKSATAVSLVVPVLALGVPIMDTVWVLFRRVRENRPLHIADKGHTFHVLMKSGLSQIQTVTFLYLLGICFSLASIVVQLATR
ncbi:MraY family glycosyltransferase [Alicyclobacillus tolerans]|uniref:UDP-GlcNAc:undecaprenyl-phosphate GlcNAc-1-phosphate transferase n=2 Tax=Alicyclobacillus tolerans TaxID=90970 RepID=A0A1M6NXS5_9BACL|nr:MULTISPECIES: MraY family glycosyltransferase [Alicyclobacillus]MDP9729665.1 UDP-GlcNAc:undecaprenyl-phosphate GlcNAc-1-phosphate transferase [Alicyclobacillus tengchongensis]QRF22723.1 undecaprenyl/decaprenyl-phosphate alpha-N-acetylglucosaminyl 1-phosphate transferase [Alicyclobacillus sp. TC]SHK00462.1 UDP-GlcNAc:undecaprenyl-phosphate GlcNAc-1-phosphate transferase [Alicyclobacillus montanus]